MSKNIPKKTDTKEQPYQLYSRSAQTAVHQTAISGYDDRVGGEYRAMNKIAERVLYATRKK